MGNVSRRSAGSGCFLFVINALSFIPALFLDTFGCAKQSYNAI